MKVCLDSNCSDIDDIVVIQPRLAKLWSSIENDGPMTTIATVTTLMAVSTILMTTMIIMDRTTNIF